MKKPGAEAPGSIRLRASRGVRSSELLSGTQHGHPSVISPQPLVTMLFSEVPKCQTWLDPAQLLLTSPFFYKPPYIVATRSVKTK